MQQLEQGEKNEGEALTGSTVWCQAWKSSSNIPLPTHQQYKKFKKGIETTSGLFITSRAKQNPIYCHLFCDVKFTVVSGSKCADLKEFSGCMCWFWLKLDGGKAPSTSAAIQPNCPTGAGAGKYWSPLSHSFPISVVFTTSYNHNTLNWQLSHWWGREEVILAQTNKWTCKMIRRSQGTRLLTFWSKDLDILSWQNSQEPGWRWHK